MSAFPSLSVFKIFDDFYSAHLDNYSQFFLLWEFSSNFLFSHRNMQQHYEEEKFTTEIKLGEIFVLLTFKKK